MQNISKPVKLTILAVIGLLVLVALYNIYSHGWVHTTTQDNVGASYTIVSDSAAANEQAETHKAGIRKLLPSGSYTITYTDNNTTYTRHITVPHFWGGITADLESKAQRKVMRLWNSTMPLLTAGSDGLLYGISPANNLHHEDVYEAYNSNGTYYPSVPQAGMPLDSISTIINNGKAVGTFGLPQPGYKNAQPASFDFATKQVVKFNKSYQGSSGVTILGSSLANSNDTGVYSVSGKKKTLDIFNGPTLTNSFDVGTAANARNSIAAASINQHVVAIGYGSDYAGSAGGDDEDKPHADTPKNYSIVSYDAASRSVLHTISIGPTNLVGTISISGNGSSVAVLNDGEVSVYSMQDGTKQVSFKMSYPQNPIWLDDNRLLFSSSTGLFEMDVNDQSATTLFSAKNLRLSDFTVSGNRVYFSAFTNNDGFNQNTKPDAYMAYLDQEATDGNDAAYKIPYQNGSFTIISFGNTIYITSLLPSTPATDVSSKYRALAVTGDTAKAQALQWLQQNIKNYQQYKILYSTTSS